MPMEDINTVPGLLAVIDNYGGMLGKLKFVDPYTHVTFKAVAVYPDPNDEETLVVDIKAQVF